MPEKATDQKVVFFSDGHYSGVPQPRFRRFEKSEGKSALHVTGLPIFRSGTFRDSMGFEHTYLSEHMHMMQSNYEILKSRGTFADVPARKNHPSPFTNTMDEVIGYVIGLSVQNFASPVNGEVYAYLMADVEVLDSAAIEKIESGLWRNRSSEIGSYVNNDDSEFWPALLGFAYVDIPAVEGLNFSKFEGVGTEYAAIIDKEGSAVADNDQGTAGAQGSAQTPPVVPQTNHAAAPAQTHSFSLSTGVTSDFAAVQAHITAIETANAEFSSMFTTLQTAARSNFVSQLAADGKILQTQVEGLTEVAQSLDEGAWGKFKAAYEAAPQNPLLGQHAAAAPGASTVTPEQAKVDNAKVVYKRLKMGGVMNLDQINASPSAQVLKAAGVDLASL